MIGETEWCFTFVGGSSDPCQEEVFSVRSGKFGSIVNVLILSKNPSVENCLINV